MSTDDFKQAALDYHRQQPAGKIKVTATKPMLTQRDLSLRIRRAWRSPARPSSKMPPRPASSPRAAIWWR
ncbi:hypothetical protein XFF6994_900005 [Xanthomonas citri pv. fuscans]|nr:hypothetical protein XFF6994_900005 [Xanthomonas citri pv. fuscans]